MTPTAKIKPDNCGTGLWLEIKHDNEIENVLIAISEDEVEPIKIACEKYLKEAK